MDFGLFFVVCTIDNQITWSSVCNANSACMMRHDGKHQHIAENESDQCNVSIDAKDCKSNVESS